MDRSRALATMVKHVANGAAKMWRAPMIAKLERVALREAFPSEVKDLSQWVRNNMDELNAATGLLLSNATPNSPLAILVSI